MLDEISIIEDLASAAWKAELQEYYFSDTAVAEILTVIDLNDEEKAKGITQDINQQAAFFCLGIERYDKLSKGKKITTALEDKCRKVTKNLDSLLPLVDSFTIDEMEWLLAQHSNIDVQAQNFMSQLMVYLWLLQYCTHNTGIKVEQGTPPILRSFIRSCLNIFEYYTGKQVVREPDPIKGGDFSQFSNFMVSLYHHIPDHIKEKLPRQPKSLEGAISEAIAENARLNAG